MGVTIFHSSDDEVKVLGHQVGAALIVQILKLAAEVEAYLSTAPR